MKDKIISALTFNPGLTKLNLASYLNCSTYEFEDDLKDLIEEGIVVSRSYNWPYTEYYLKRK